MSMRLRALLRRLQWRQGVNMWCVGEVIEAADGKTTKRSAKCKSTLPWGAVRIKYTLEHAT